MVENILRFIKGLIYLICVESAQKKHLTETLVPTTCFGFEIRKLLILGPVFYDYPAGE